MVIEDVFSPQKKSKSKNADLQLRQIAAPIDRLAAFVGEMPVFVPLLSVFLAPFRHDISVAQLTGSQVQLLFAGIGIGLTSAATLIAYQTLFIYFFGATPGKYFVGLRVVSVLGETKPSLTMCLLRSLTMCLEFALLGFPWLASLSHPQRRVLHDRLSDTYVTCLDDKKTAPAPMFVEKQLAKNVQAPGWALFLLAIIFCFNYFNMERKDLSIANEFENNDQLCSQVSVAVKDWHSNIDSNPSRIAVALALFEAQNIDEACLDKEAHFSMWRNQDKDMGYLAHALSNSTDEKIFNDYLDKVCAVNKDGDACQFTSELQSEKENSLIDVRSPASVEVAEPFSNLADVHRDFIRLHLERQLHGHNQLHEALKVIDESTATPDLADFLNLERIKIMWEMDRMPEARAVFQASRAHMSEPSRIQLSSWMCSAEILSGCSKENRLACSQFISDFDQLESDPQPEVVELNYIRAQKCLTSDSMDYVNIDKKLYSERAHNYLSALELVNDRKFRGAREIFRQIADQTESDEFQTQANADLVRLSQSKLELDYFFEEFLSNGNYQADPKFAFELLNKYLSVGDFERVTLVGEDLLKIFPYKKSLYSTLFSEARKHKNFKFADKVQAQFKKLMPESKSLSLESSGI